ncbi:response regulator [Spirosoma endophyticum]|uniref:response regulator n=1 Tax=Spirosoma endophyticum TaxID=662367 RepID=UPI001FE86510|nr:response regulator [Spirosoma endophyticum]
MLQEVYLPRRDDGWALLKTLKTHPVYQPIPVIVLSQSADIADIQMAYELAAASYITKPATFHQWLKYFYTLRSYWLTLVTLPTSLT